MVNVFQHVFLVLEFVMCKVPNLSDKRISFANIFIVLPMAWIIFINCGQELEVGYLSTVVCVKLLEETL